MRIRTSKYTAGLLIIVVALLMLPVFMYLMLQIPVVQTVLSRKITSFASETLNTTVKLSKVSYSVKNELVLKDFFVEDYKYDTLLYAKKFKLRLWAVYKNTLYINKVALDGLKVKVEEDSSGYTNLQYLLDNLPQKEPKEKKGGQGKIPAIKISSLELTDWTLSYSSPFKAPDSALFDAKNFEIGNLNVALKKISLSDSVTQFKLTDFHFKDKSGFEVKKTSFDFRFGPKSLSVDEMVLNLNKSHFYLPKIVIRYDSVAQLSSPDKLQAEVLIDTQTTINSYDLGFFVSALGNTNITVNLGAYIYGSLNDLNIYPLEIYVPQDNKIVANIELIGLPDLVNTYADIEFVDIDLYLDQLQSLRNSNGVSFFTMPQQLSQLNHLNLTGRMTGLLNDMDIDLQLSSNIGNIASNFNIRRDSLTVIDGIFETSELHLDKLLQNEMLGIVSLTDTLNISIKGKEFWGENNTRIYRIDFNGYPYSNIGINGYFTNNSFSGEIAIADSNLNFNFAGVIEKTEKNNKAKFVMNLYKANLYALHFDKDDPEAFLSFGLMADLQGSNIDDFVGVLKFSEPLIYVKYMEKIKIRNFKVSSYITQYFAGKPYKEIILTSDIIDGTLQGIIESQSLAKYFKNLTAYFLPSLPPQKTLDKVSLYDDVTGVGSNLKYMLNIKSTEAITRIFAPQISIAPHTQIKGEFLSLRRSFYTTVESDSIRIKDNILKKLKLKLDTQNDTLHFAFVAKEMLFNKIQFENFSFVSSAKNDSIFSVLKWNNTSSAKENTGLISFSTYLSRVDTNLNFYSVFNKDSVTINDVTWFIDKLIIERKAGKIKLNSHFADYRHHQDIGIVGEISDSPRSRLLIRLQNLDVAQFNPLLPNIKLKGNLTGNTLVSNLKTKPAIVSNNIIQKFYVNDVKLSTLAFASKLNSKSDTFHFKIFTEKAVNRLNIRDLFAVDSTSDKFVEVQGFYNLKSKEYYADMNFRKFKLKAFYPYVKNWISGISPFATLQGKIKLKGYPGWFGLNGDLFLSNITMKIRQTNVTYNINNGMHIHMDNRKIVIDTTSINTTEGHGHGKLWGRIDHENFKNFDTKIFFRPDTFLVLNLPFSDTALYYGTAIITGDVALLGTGPSTSVKANLKTEDKTNLTIMMNTPQKTTLQNDFFTFVKRDTAADTLSVIDQMLRQQAKKKNSNSSLDLNVNLQITPDAKFKIIMDPQTGEQLELQGIGNLNIQQNPYGGLILFGAISVDKGYYQLSLENIINKKFVIKPGSTIKWNGRPTDAELDLTAVYTLKGVNLYDLVLDDAYWNERTVVNCNINLKGKLTSPEISFDLELPKADQKIASQVMNLDESEKTKQVLSLLVLGRFQPLPGLVFDPNAMSGKMSASDVISGQLSHWLSNLDENLELNVNYQSASGAADDQSGQLPKNQFEVALSYKLWNERVVINTDVGVGNQTGVPQANNTNPNQIIGDAEIEVKLNKKGNIRFKAFNRTNRNEFYDKGPYTQGIGLFFQKDFDAVNLRKKSKRDSTKNK